MDTPTSRRAVLGALAAAPLAVAVPDLAGATAMVPVSDLGQACLWAVRHNAWISQASALEVWNDEALDAEMARIDAVINRAMAEPSLSLHDLGAKARLALDEFEIGSHERSELDRTERLILAVLREAVALIPAGGLAPVSPDRAAGLLHKPE